MNHRLVLCSAAWIAACAFVATSLAEPPRTPVKGSVKIQGRSIEQLILFDSIATGARPALRPRPENWGYVLVPGKFVPVSESAEGVFFQATRGIRLTRPDTGQDFVDGGLWVSKLKQSEIYTYFGDARSVGPGLDVTNRRLTFDEMRQLKTGREPAAKGTKP